MLLGAPANWKVLTNIMNRVKTVLSKRPITETHFCIWFIRFKCITFSFSNFHEKDDLTGQCAGMLTSLTFKHFDASVPLWPEKTWKCKTHLWPFVCFCLLFYKKKCCYFVVLLSLWFNLALVLLKWTFGPWVTVTVSAQTHPKHYGRRLILTQVACEPFPVCNREDVFDWSHGKPDAFEGWKKTAF